jgi:hypothetical protein
MRKHILELAIAAAAGLAVSGIYATQGDPPAEVREAQKRCLGNMKQLGTAFLLYLADYDDMYPRASVQGSDGAWLWNMPMPHRTLPMLADRSAYPEWAPAIYPYLRNSTVFYCPLSRIEGTPPTDRETLQVGYTYNGLLHQLHAVYIAAPAELMIAWEGLGDKRFADRYYSNPQLRCDDRNVPCRFQSAGGPPGVMFAPAGKMTIHISGTNFAYADAHAEWHRVGLQVSSGSPGPPFTDVRVDPFTGYDADGNPGWAWHLGLHPARFRPDAAAETATGGEFQHVRLTPLPN